MVLSAAWCKYLLSLWVKKNKVLLVLIIINKFHYSKYNKSVQCRIFFPVNIFIRSYCRCLGSFTQFTFCDQYQTWSLNNRTVCHCSPNLNQISFNCVVFFPSAKICLEHGCLHGERKCDSALTNTESETTLLNSAFSIYSFFPTCPANRRIASVHIVSEMLPPGGGTIEIRFYGWTFNPRPLCF